MAISGETINAPANKVRLVSARFKSQVLAPGVTPASVAASADNVIVPVTPAVIVAVIVAPLAGWINMTSPHVETSTATPAESTKFKVVVKSSPA